MKNRPLTIIKCELPLLRGHFGEDVSKVQIMLNFQKQGSVSEINYNKGLFDKITEDNILGFQKSNGLTESGEVNKETLDKLSSEYMKRYSYYKMLFLNEKKFFLKIGDKGNDVILLKERLNFLSFVFNEIDYCVLENEFDVKTRDNVIAFQKIMNITSDGVVASYCWDLLAETFFSAKQ